MKYLVIIKQRGEGCDYTIGCDTRVTELETDIPDFAAIDKQLAKQLLEDYGNLDDIAHICYVPMSHVRDVDVRALQAAEHAVNAARKAAETEASERAAYERLRSKYGGC
jgi:hypothetical protein